MQINWNMRFVNEFHYYFKANGAVVIIIRRNLKWSTFSVLSKINYAYPYRTLYFEPLAVNCVPFTAINRVAAEGGYMAREKCQINKEYQTEKHVCFALLISHSLTIFDSNFTLIRQCKHTHTYTFTRKQTNQTTETRIHSSTISFRYINSIVIETT